MPTVIGYGTLLSRHSLARTISREAGAVRPVVVQGHRRLFNLRVYKQIELPARFGDVEAERSAANVEADSAASFNGLAFDVTRHELELLDQREWHYERQTAELLDFETREPIGEGIVYVAPLDSPCIERDPQRLLPRWRCAALGRMGAYQVSEAFGQFYDETTFLADGQTLAMDCYRDLIEVMEREVGALT